VYSFKEFFHRCEKSVTPGRLHQEIVNKRDGLLFLYFLIKAVSERHSTLKFVHSNTVNIRSILERAPQLAASLAPHRNLYHNHGEKELKLPFFSLAFFVHDLPHHDKYFTGHKKSMQAPHLSYMSHYLNIISAGRAPLQTETIPFLHLLAKLDLSLGFLFYSHNLGILLFDFAY